MVETNVGVEIVAFNDELLLLTADGGGIDRLTTVAFGLAAFAIVTTLFNAGNGRIVPCFIAADEVEVSTTFCELIRCTLIVPFGPLICVGFARFAGFGKSVGNLENGNDNRLATTGAADALRRVID